MMRFHTVAEVASWLGCSDDLVRSHITKGRLLAINIGSGSTKEYRVAEDSLQKFIESSRVKSQRKGEPRRKTPLVRKPKWIRDLLIVIQA